MNSAVKLHTANAFSKAALQYAQHAKVQQQAAEVLLNWLEGKNLGVCLDLGAGPGVNFQPLSAQSDTLIGLDLSHGMLKQASGNKICADMDALPFQQHSLNSVFSNFALQWTSDINSLFKQLNFCLAPQGKVYCSVVVAGSLTQIKQAFLAVNRGAINPFYQPTDVVNYAQQAGFRLVREQMSTLTDVHANAKAALHSIKAIGASSASIKQKPLTPRQYQQVLANYPLTTTGLAQLTYQVLLLELEKPA